MSTTAKSSPPKLHNFINGKAIGPLSQKYIENINPATQSITNYLPDSSNLDVQDAIAAAASVRLSWGASSLETRAKICNRIAREILLRRDELALAESRDTGKPLSLASTMDIPRAAENFEFFAQASVMASTDCHPMSQGINYTSRRPVGIVGLITPWNLPLYLLSWKVAPALMMGNTLVIKPSELTPSTATLLADICITAGLPAGVMNIVHGTGPEVGQAIVSSAAISAISFTGGTATGALVAKAASTSFKKVSLELGGKNPCVVFADCDLDQAISTIVTSSFRNSGQICLCTSRLLIQESIRPAFETKFLAAVAELKVGDPLDPQSTMGPLISTAHRDKMAAAVTQARKEGLTILTGSGLTKDLSSNVSPLAFFNPTVIADVSTDSTLFTDELFGPVVTLNSFRDETEALALANASNYGLAACVWTSNLATAHRFSHALEAGIVWVNNWLQRDLRTPFGGMKASGIGREGGKYSLDFFSELKNIYIDVPTMVSSEPTMNVMTPQSSSKGPSTHDTTTSTNGSEDASKLAFDAAPKPVGAYPHAKIAGDLLFLSGIGPRNPVDNSIPGGPMYTDTPDASRVINDTYDIRAQTQAVIDNMELILTKSGATMEDIIDVQVFLVDMQRDFAGFNEVYNRVFKNLNVTRTTCAIRALPTPIAVEFKVIASAPK